MTNPNYPPPPKKKSPKYIKTEVDPYIYLSPKYVQTKYLLVLTFIRLMGFNPPTQSLLGSKNITKHVYKHCLYILQCIEIVCLNVDKR